jgi:hypothetical protein
MKRLFFGLIFILLILAISHAPQAKVTGECADCHTMHYSQAGGQLSEWGQNGPYNSLTTNTCVGCHTAPSATQNDGTGTPYVHSIQAPTYGDTGTESTTNTLAGGSFYWMKNTHKTTGHDVDGIATAFDMLPPGYPVSIYDSNRDASWPGSQSVTCAGTYGCHGETGTADPYVSIAGGHHGDDSGTDGSTLAKSYRLLDGVAGKEDSDWEYQPTFSAHNQYKAIHRTLEITTDSTTISYLCGQCHGNFHSGSGNLNDQSPWLRHPTDVKLPGSGEYLDYNTDKTYSVVAPVGSQDVTLVLQSVNPGTTDCIVTCISCHRAHGSEYYKLMRWDYKSWPGGGYDGCGVCHTSKK